MLCGVCRARVAFGWVPDGSGDLIAICETCKLRWDTAARVRSCCLEACPSCGEGIADGGTHAHGDLLVTRVHSPHAARVVES